MSKTADPELRELTIAIFNKRWHPNCGIEISAAMVQSRDDARQALEALRQAETQTPKE